VLSSVRLFARLHWTWHLAISLYKDMRLLVSDSFKYDYIPPPATLLRRAFAADRVVLSEEGAVATLKIQHRSRSLTTTGIELAVEGKRC
jgi:hypothetical protein